jgi:4-hydroxy-2-oxoheptanedioate aldolase
MESTLYPPQGSRGFHPFTRATGQGKKTISNGDALIRTVIVETLKSYHDLDEILKIPELDVVYLGGYDMSVVLGVPGKLDDPKMVEFFRTSIPKIRNAGKAAGVYFRNSEDLARYQEMGANFFVYGVDSAIYIDAMGAAKSLVDRLAPAKR